jgi:hypothetical protein
MADRVAANIIIGGCVTPDQFAALTELVAAEDLRVEWDGEPFDPNKIEPDQPLRLYAHEVPWGSFEALEQYCCDQQIAYQRWSGSCSGSFGAERIVYDGKTGPFNFAVDDDDRLVLHAQTIGQLGSMRAIRRYIAEAEIEIPAFSVQAN